MCMVIFNKLKTDYHIPIIYNNDVEDNGIIPTVVALNFAKGGYARATGVDGEKVKTKW